MKKKFFEAAKAVALSSQGKYRLGAVVVNRGSIIAARCNSYRKTHPALAKYTPYPFQHAEAAAVIAAGPHACRGGEIYVCRLDRGGHTCLARPCTNVCQPFMSEMGIKKAYYTIDNHSYGVLEL